MEFYIESIKLVGLFLIWQEIYIAHCKDDLQFWERDPRFDIDPKMTSSVEPPKNISASSSTSSSETEDTRRNLRESMESSTSHSRENIEKNSRQPSLEQTQEKDKSYEPHHRMWFEKLARITPVVSKKIIQRRRLRQQSTKVPGNKTTPKTTSTTTTTTTTTKPPLTGFSTHLSPYSIARHLESLTNKFPEANITQEIIGKTEAYNDIVLLKIIERKSGTSKVFRTETNKYADENDEKKIILIVHGLSVMGMNALPCLRQEDKFVELLHYYFAHLDKFDIFLIPMANPDGLGVSSLIWNKNTSPQDACSGVALDRNFDVAWNETRKTGSCSQQFSGLHPFSEHETKAIRKVFHSYSNTLIAYLHVHAGTYSADIFKGDAVLYPKGYTEVVSDDDKYIDLKGEIEEAMKNASFRVLSVNVDTLYSWYGKVTGSSVDYASSIYGIPYAMELVMQLYTNDMTNNKSEEKETNVALREMWKRVIDVIFTSIHRSLSKANEVKK